VHNRDTLAQLIAAKVDSVLAFEWQGQMRYYWEDDRCIVRMVQASFDYGYEYLNICLFFHLLIALVFNSFTTQDTLAIRQD
jgi:hypothetical protein